MARIAGFGFGSRSKDVLLNIYDLHEHNESLHGYGLGFYHSGVVVGKF